MRSSVLRLTTLGAILPVLALVAGPVLAVDDSIKLGSVTAGSGTGTVQVPIYVKDNAGTLIGIDVGPTPGDNKNIQSILLNVTYTDPSNCVTNTGGLITTDAGSKLAIYKQGSDVGAYSYTFTNDKNLTTNTQAWVFTMAEVQPGDPGGGFPANPLIPWNQAAPDPGEKVGVLTFTLTACPAGYVINLTFDESNTVLASLTNGFDEQTSDQGTAHLTINTATITVPGGQATPTNTSVPPTATNTSVPPTATNTGVPPTATNTGVPPTATNTGVPPTATNTGVPPTATNTGVPPTATNTSVPPTATNTGVPPTSTNTPVPPTATNTPVPPTATNTPGQGGGSQVTGIPTLDARSLILLAAMLAAIGLMLSKRLVK